MRTNIPYKQRICDHYSLNEVGNEQHYLMKCSNAKFTTIRAQFIPNRFQINQSFGFFSNHDLFIYILSMRDKFINHIVAKYCYDTLKTFYHL